MGLFGIIKDIIRFKKALNESIEESKRKQLLYLSMSPEEMAALSDSELLEAALSRTEHRVDNFEDSEAAFHSLNSSQKVIYSINWLEMEVNNGGLCQFFVNSSRMVAPYISGYMSIIGANDHKELFDKFISDNHIDLLDLSSFAIDDIDEFEKQTKRYPFDAYDDAFYDLEPLESYLKKFARKHLEDL